MSLVDTREWIKVADDDFETVLFLNTAYKKKLEIMCYHCNQAAEKYLKSFLVYNDIIPEKTHDLEKLLDKCIKIDKSFLQIERECVYLNRFKSDMRYPFGPQVTENDVVYVIKITEKIKNLEIFDRIRKEIEKIKE